jgi:hypothetical protein
MPKRFAFALSISLFALAVVVPPAAGAAAPTAEAGGVFSMPAPLAGLYGQTPAARSKQSRGYLVRDAARLSQLKDLVRPSAPGGNGHGGGGGGSSCGTANSIVVVSCPGLNDNSVTPSDSTGAIGPTRYVELVNLKFGIYSRTGSAISSGSLASLTGDSGGNLSDPQVIWDTGTGRFYYVVLDFSSNILLFGFSKSDTPAGASDFCKYGVDYGYGSNIPDYPKLGDTSDFLLIGVNVFSSSDVFQGSDIDWVTKPPAGTTCPSGGFTAARHNVSTSSDEIATPVPANQTDPSGTGWVVAGQDPTAPSSHGVGNYIQLFQVTKNGSTGGADIAALAGTVSTGDSFLVPPVAPQAGTTNTLDTLDARLTQAVSAIGGDLSDPTAVSIWTQHTVAGGAGSKVRWYDINPAGLTVPQQGEVANSSLYAFNGAISPDRRVVTSGTSMFGDSMVLGFNTSSGSTYPAIKMVYKLAGQPQTSFTPIAQSSTFNRDFSCSPTCRWGDYAGASPDPAASITANHGQVWLTNVWNQSSRSFFQTAWRTWNFAVAPA